ncbi:hypothetical protein RB597_005101 [Gaeumannomyces tritici]
MADQDTKAPEAAAVTTSAAELVPVATPEAPASTAPLLAGTAAPSGDVPAEKPAGKTDERAPVPTPAPAAAEAPNALEAKSAEKTEALAPEPAAAPAPAASKEAEPKTAEIGVPVAPAPAPATSAPLKDLWTTAQAHTHKEIWGVSLTDPETHVPSQIILQKYLNANDGDLAKAKDQLTKTLDWRAKTKPLELLEKKHNKEKFSGLGYVTTYTTDTGSKAKEVFTWNIYGSVKSMDDTFGKLEDFIDWRVALMELAVHDLSISTATERITAEQDPYKIYQVHDYKSISFLRQAPAVKAASKETITVLAANYPELLKEKFFINVPVVMGFMYAVMKLFVAPNTLKKFHPMSNGGALAEEFSASELPGLGEKLPKEYGGQGPELSKLGKQTPLEE